MTLLDLQALDAPNGGPGDGCGGSNLSVLICGDHSCVSALLCC